MENREVLYAKWLSGEITDEELVALEGTDALAELKQITGTVDKWSMPAYDTASGYKKFKQAHQSKPTKKYWGILGAVILLLVLSLIVWKAFFTNEKEVLFAEAGQNQHVILADASEIWLNDGSTIEYNEKNWQEQRTINLTGEAMFEVSKGSPFIVNTRHGSIQVLGTQFNVRAWGNKLHVSCYEGSVQVSSPDDQQTILTVGEGVTVVNGLMNEKTAIETKSPAWQANTSRFSNEELLYVVQELERQYDIQVSLKSADHHFSGIFRHDGLDEALIAICKPLGLKYTVSEDQKSVLIE